MGDVAATLKAHFISVGQMFDSLCREMQSHLGADETLNMETLLETWQVTKSTGDGLYWLRHTQVIHTHTILHLPVTSHSLIL